MGDNSVENCNDWIAKALTHLPQVDDFTKIFYKPVLWDNIINTSCEIALRWVPQNPID